MALRNIQYLIVLGISLILTSCGGENSSHKENSTTLPVEKSAFQTKINGKQTNLYILQNNQGMKVGITNYGGRIVSWLAPDKQGDFDDIVLGFDSIEGYLNANEEFFGALIGRYGNRIAEGEFKLNGQKYELPINDNPNHLHGGSHGFHNVVWDAHQPDNRHLVLHYISKDGEAGYPGTLKVQVQYILSQNNELKIDYTATTDDSTVINLTNHAFFNLAGAGSGSIGNQELQINAGAFTTIDSNSIPTGEIRPVEGPPFDFRKTKANNKEIQQENQQPKFAKSHDHNFVINKKQKGALTLAATAYESTSGRKMNVYTTEPGLQFYSGNFLDGSDVGKGSKAYNRRGAFCLETQHYPDTPNQHNFPSTVLSPHKVFHSHSVYAFYRSSSEH